MIQKNRSSLKDNLGRKSESVQMAYYKFKGHGISGNSLDNQMDIIAVPFVASAI